MGSKKLKIREIKKEEKTVTGKIFTGSVVSNKMAKTVVVEIEKKFQHPIYKKMLKRSRKLKADTNNFSLLVGDAVRIKQVRPLSRSKNFMVIEKIKEEKK